MATDEEIERIIERAEAGVEDLLRAYEAAEAQYLAAAANAPVEPTWVVTTTAATVPTKPR